ncbi:hypothetical protein Paes_1247 [Prosthecochloris aestuarii DSM 271]|uniref:Uncharacterized protein n=1 Tax=Prosthecochloris aestuarii (strain DSM 271 / SK 413) TaxID=290512 RepID=B4S886_PROA2|nr:hypothetical protein [Prosthecochloris aestuarii]ACF46273.1 hypothetical protein Paes_1247 [Prosthecochloris aestuarii DSM 271]
MNTTGKKNMIVATLYFVLTLGLGMALMRMLQTADPAWLESPARKMLAGAHLHGSLEALLNLLFGYLICRFGTKTPMLSTVASWLLLLGMLHSAGAYLGGLGLTAAKVVAPFGAVSLISGILVMVPILAKGVDTEN